MGAVSAPARFLTLKPSKRLRRRWNKVYSMWLFTTLNQKLMFCIVFYSKTGSENSVCLVFLQFQCVSDPGQGRSHTKIAKKPRQTDLSDPVWLQKTIHTRYEEKRRLPTLHNYPLLFSAKNVKWHSSWRFGPALLNDNRGSSLKFRADHLLHMARKRLLRHFANIGWKGRTIQAKLFDDTADFLEFAMWGSHSLNLLVTCLDINDFS